MLLCKMLFDGCDSDLGEEFYVPIPPGRCKNQAAVLRLENKSLSCWRRRIFYFLMFFSKVLSLSFFCFYLKAQETKEQ